MYELPSDQDLATLLGRKLVLISCSANQVILQFDEHTSLVAETAFTLANGSGGEETGDVPLSRGYVFALLEREIVGVDVLDARRTLALRFSNGHLLRFESDQAYESFHLTLKGKQFVV